ncbi:trypsin Inhibitor like cysteine rich domain protein [Ancylostoma caninum]|uniref:Trypsin Inhibitor like cysteine rich domain protein n=1 Tax=Ancylostoma caninum TaxID=29170 RepID=A0A368F7V8_ANCCA|nr:trypsin Inhibitor like cysteine rich domain protein [Ancylostoma caninum]
MGCGIPGKPGRTSPVSKPGGTGNGYDKNRGTKPLVCGPDEVVNPCGNLCEPTCENAFGKLKLCPRICKPTACVCKPNYYRKDGKCVPQQSCEKPGTAGTDNMTSYGDEPIVPDGQNNSCEDSECEEGMVCVEGETESVCVAKDPANNCETTICPTGAVCEYRETECIPDKACFAEAVCVEYTTSDSTPMPTGTTNTYVDEPETGGSDENLCLNFPCPSGMKCSLQTGEPKCIPITTRSTPKPTETKTYVDEPETGGPEPNPCFNFPCPSGQECSLQTGEAKCVPKGMRCSINETFAPCGNICEGKCSDVGNLPRPCRPICAPEACACKDGFYRNEAGDCVEKKDCVLSEEISHEDKEEMLKVCGENEKVNKCGRQCENNCTQAGKGPTKCKPLCAEPACVCDDGYYRNSLGKCVLERLCSTTCPPNEHGNACGDLCELSCDEQLNKERELPCIEVCAPPACVCNDGYIRLKRGGPCVPKNSCPKKLLPTGSTGDNSNPYKKRRFHSQ